MSDNGLWLCILDYAKFKKISISTVRRYIKSERIRYKLERGKFLIFVHQDLLENRQKAKSDHNLRLMNEVIFLREQLRSSKEENEDLRMLVGLLENSKKSGMTPEVPVE